MAGWVEVSKRTNDATAANKGVGGASVLSGQIAGQPANVLGAQGSCTAELLSKCSLHCLYNSLFLKNDSCWAH